MADVDDVRNKLLARMDEMLNETRMQEVRTRAVLNLAEAYAWVTSPGQPHGGTRIDKG